MVGANPGGNPFASTPQGGVTQPPGAGSDILSQVWGRINPQLQAAADAINRRSTYGAQAISDLTGVYGQRMAAASGMDVFGPEKKPLRAAADWGQSSLVGSGRQQAGVLGAALQQAGPGITAGSDLDLAKQGKGAGGAAYGTGISWLDAQVAKAAAAQTRAALEPSFAAGMGQMQQGILASQLARQLADQQSTIEARIPDLIDTLTERGYQHAEDTRSFNEQVRQFNVQQAERKAEVVGPNAPTVSGRKQYWDKVAADRTTTSGIQYVGTNSGIRPVTDTAGRQVLTAEGRKNRINEIYTTEVNPDGTLTARGQQMIKALGGSGAGVTTAPTKTSTPKAYQHVTIGGKAYNFDPNDGTYHDPVTGKVVQPKVPPGGTVKTPTGNQTATAVAGWYTGKQETKVAQTGTDKQGNPIYKKVPTGETTGQLTYQQAYRTLRAQGYDDQKARSYLDVHWKRGERGRPWLSGTERTTLKQAGIPATASYDQGQHPFLDQKQAQALDKANLLPGGKLQNGRYMLNAPLTPAQRAALAKAKQRPSAQFFQGGWRGYLNAKQAEALRKAGKLPPGEMRNGRYYISPGTI